MHGLLYRYVMQVRVRLSRRPKLACARHPASAASRATFLNPPSAYVPLPTAPHLAPVHVVPALCPTLPHAVLMARTQQQRRPPPAATRDPLGRPVPWRPSHYPRPPADPPAPVVRCTAMCTTGCSGSPAGSLGRPEVAPPLPPTSPAARPPPDPRPPLSYAVRPVTCVYCFPAKRGSLV